MGQPCKGLKIQSLEQRKNFIKSLAEFAAFPGEEYRYIHQAAFIAMRIGYLDMKNAEAPEEKQISLQNNLLPLGSVRTLEDLMGLPEHFLTEEGYERGKGITVGVVDSYYKDYHQSPISKLS